MNYESYVIDIEIDHDAGIIILTKGDNTQYEYTIEELQGKGVIDNALQGGAELTVYSQNEKYTLEEYLFLFDDSERVVDHEQQ